MLNFKHGGTPLNMYALYFKHRQTGELYTHIRAAIRKATELTQAP